MQSSSLKKRIDNYINSVVEKRFKDILEKLDQERSETEQNIQQIQALKENMQSISTQLNEMSAFAECLKIVEENVRNNNIELEVLEDIKRRLQVLEENTRNNNNIISKILRDNNSSVWEAKFEALKNSISKLQRKAKTIDNEVTANTESSADLNSKAYDEIDYFSFENYFRGDESVIRERQKVYLPYFQGCNNVLDLGCGRGEFLELLQESGIKAKGVDFYEEFVIYGRNKGLDIVSGDAIAFLENMPDKADGIFAGQLVEHLTVGQINALCKRAFDKLEEGKYLIMETPNPMSLAIYTHAFYMDPSHQKPVHPLTLKYLAEKAGFREVQILFPEESRLDERIPSLEGDNIRNLEEFNASMQKVAEYLYGSQDYAIIAKK